MTGRRNRIAWSTVLALVFGAALAGGCSPSSPATPTYAADVQPIMMAHCVRCHGANDSLQGDPTSDSPTFRTAPTQGYLDHFEDRGTCPTSTTAAPGCMRGAHYYASDMVGIEFWGSFFPMMPPSPAQLSDWERDILTRWVKNPICGTGPACSGADGGSD